MESLVVVFDGEKAADKFREMYSETPICSGISNPDYREIQEDGVYGAIVNNVSSAIFDFYFSFEFYEWFSDGSYKIGQFIKSEGDSKGGLGGFVCNCADTDLPMIEDIYEKLTSIDKEQKS